MTDAVESPEQTEEQAFNRWADLQVLFGAGMERNGEGAVGERVRCRTTHYIERAGY
jgi:hypothetical protein